MLSHWCGREDSNFHGLSATTTSTLRVYQFRHDRTCMRESGREPLTGKAAPLPKGRCLRNAAVLIHFGTVPNSPFTIWPPDRYPWDDDPRFPCRCRNGAARPAGICGRRPGASDGPDHSGSADQRRRAASRSFGPGDEGARRRRDRDALASHRISLKPQLFRVRVTVDSRPLAGTPISALLNVALPPGGSVRAGGAIVQE